MTVKELMSRGGEWTNRSVQLHYQLQWINVLFRMCGVLQIEISASTSPIGSSQQRWCKSWSLTPYTAARKSNMTVTRHRLSCILPPGLCRLWNLT